MEVVFARRSSSGDGQRGDVELDWCGKCRGFWFDRGELAETLELEGEVEVTRDHPASDCPACRKRGAVLWTSTLDRTAVMACLECGGCFVLESALRKRRLSRAPFTAGFVCTRCRDRYELEQVHLRDGKLWCARCAPADAPAAPREEAGFRGALERLARFLGLD
jgi:hypothetical protein